MCSFLLGGFSLGTLGNIILAGVGVLMIIGYAIVIYRHLKEKKEQEK